MYASLLIAPQAVLLIKTCINTVTNCIGPRGQFARRAGRPYVTRIHAMCRLLTATKGRLP
jgi:hypothetical protein